MRHIVLAVTLVLWTPHVEAAILFTPDDFTLTINPLFDDTGTDTFCWQCGDADPLNDFRAVLGTFPDHSGPWNQFQGHGGSVLLQSTAPTYTGLEANFSLHATLFTSSASLPQSLVNPSVSFGVIPGRILGVESGTKIVIECCDGLVGPLEIRQAFFPSTPFIVPPGGLTELVLLELHPFGNQVPYTPAAAVPEPASLLLLGSAFTAVALRRRRARAVNR